MPGNYFIRLVLTVLGYHHRAHVLKSLLTRAHWNRSCTVDRGYGWYLAKLRAAIDTTRLKHGAEEVRAPSTAAAPLTGCAARPKAAGAHDKCMMMQPLAPLLLLGRRCLGCAMRR